MEENTSERELQSKEQGRPNRWGNQETNHGCEEEGASTDGMGQRESGSVVRDSIARKCGDQAPTRGKD